MLSGEAGIGKTTLAEALCREAEAQGARILIGRCYDLSETPPYGPWADLFARYQPADGHTPPTIFLHGDPSRTVTNQAELFNQTREFLAAISAAHPTLLLLDDLHWADTASLDLLRFLARSLDTMPLLLIATYRDDELTRRHPLYQLLPLLVRESAATRIDLRRIELADIRSLIDARYALSEDDAIRLTTYLDRRSEGNPLFLGELLRTLEAERALRPAAAGGALGDLTEIRVPTLLRQVIDGRLGRLDEEAQQLLAVASVVGHEVPLAVWATVAERDEEKILSAVEQAAETHLLSISRDGERMQFAHALIREALYEGIPPMRRRIWHRCAAEALAADPSSDPDAVAYHFRTAGDARAYDWLIQAGDRAHRAYALVTAADRFEAALALVRTDAASAGERGWLLYRIARLRRFSDPKQGIANLDEAIALATQAEDRLLAANARYDRGMLRNWTGSRRQGIADMQAGLAARRELSPADEARRKALPSILAMSDEMVTLGAFALQINLVGRFSEACALAERVIREISAEAPGELIDGSALGDTHYALGRAYAGLGHPEQARQAFARARERYEAVGHSMVIGNTRYIELLRVMLPYYADRIAERRHIASEAEAAYTKASSSGGTANMQPGFVWAWLLLLEGEWNAAERALEGKPATHPTDALEAILLSWRGEGERAWQLVHAALLEGPQTEPGDGEFGQCTGLQRVAASLALDADDLPTARAWLEAHDRWLEWSGAILGRSAGQTLWAQYFQAAGDPERAFAHAQRALALATEPRQPLALLAAHRMLGELAADAGRFDDAATNLTESLTLAEACAAPYERALTLLALAELRVATGETDVTQTLLDETRAICTPLDARLALARAETLADRLAAARQRTPGYPAGLSGREVEVLLLIAAGKSNREIADALFLSPATVNVHVTHILTKTDSGNRTAAALFAREHGLA